MLTMAERVDIATKEIRGINIKIIISVVVPGVLGVWYLSGKLNSIENKLDLQHVAQIYQHRNDSLQNHNIEVRLDKLENKTASNNK